MARFVIVPGGWGGGWEWREVERFLRECGHDASRVTLTGLGERSHLMSPSVDLDSHVEDVVQHLQFEGLHGVVLVGHSYGGMVITGVADRASNRIAQLVYVDAFIPHDGESLFDLLPDTWASTMRARAVDGSVPPPGDDPLHPSWYVERARPHPLAAFEQPLHLTAAGDAIPRAYVRCLRSDVPLDLARAAGWTMFEVDTHHDAQVDDPKALAEVLSAAAS